MLDDGERIAGGFAWLLDQIDRNECFMLPSAIADYLREEKLIEVARREGKCVDYKLTGKGRAAVAAASLDKTPSITEAITRSRYVSDTADELIGRKDK